jgi:transcription elongation factor GreA
MYDELTEVDIAKMREEINYRVTVLRPKLIEDVQTARGFGDLSENFEYKAAKQEKNRNDSRVRYLERMIKTAKVISGESKSDEIGLFDTVELFFEEDGTTQTIRLTTTLRQDALLGIISPKSPLGKALMGHKTGDRVRVEANPEYSYDVVIRSVIKGEDDESLPISSY